MICAEDCAPHENELL